MDRDTGDAGVGARFGRNLAAQDEVHRTARGYGRRDIGGRLQGQSRFRRRPDPVAADRIESECFDLAGQGAAVDDAEAYGI